MINHSKIAGAMYDFMAYLYSRSDDFQVGRKHPPHAMIDHFDKWSKLRNLDLSYADVEHWNYSDEELREEYPDLQKLYENWLKAEEEYTLLRKLLRDPKSYDK